MIGVHVSFAARFTCTVFDAAGAVAVCAATGAMAQATISAANRKLRVLVITPSCLSIY
jgi:hypothetical protein